MNKKIKKVLIVCLLLLGIFVFCTPMGAIRTSIFFQDPMKLFTTDFIDITDQYYGNLEEDHTNAYKIYKLTDPLYDEATDGYLENWAIYKVGIFYFSQHFGFF